MNLIIGFLIGYIIFNEKPWTIAYRIYFRLKKCDTCNKRNISCQCKKGFSIVFSEGSRKDFERLLKVVVHLGEEYYAEKKKIRSKNE